MFSTLYIYTSYILQWSTYRWFTSCNMVLLRKTGFRNWCQVVMFLVTRPPIAWSVNKRLQDNWNPEWTFNLHWTHAYWVVTFTSFLSKDLEFIWPCLFSPNFRLMAGSHGSQVLSHLRSIAQSQLLRAGSWDLQLHTGPRSQVPSMTWMPTWQHILEVRLGTCVATCQRPLFVAPSSIYMGAHTYTGIMCLEWFIFVCPFHNFSVVDCMQVRLEPENEATKLSLATSCN